MSPGLNTKTFHNIAAHLTATEPWEATTREASRAGACTEPQVPSRRSAMGPETTARHSRTTKSMLGMPMCVVTMLTGTPLYRPAWVTAP